MKFFLIGLFLFKFSFAFEVDITIDPYTPIADETFKVIFEVTSDSDSVPIIKFDPLGASVQREYSMGTSTQTTYINGKITSTKSVKIAYELMPKRVGNIYLRNITVELDGAVKRYQTIRKTVLKEPSRPKDIILVADVDKNEVFVNESILVRYYLYSRVNLNGSNIIKFPALDKFMKRFHQEKDRPERVEYNGELYVRRIIYTAQLFASKEGDYKVDSLKMRVSYSDRTRDPFGSFGFGSFGRQKSKTLTSRPVKVKVKKLPVENVPADFTGLVGEHRFKLKFNKKKFVVGEPIEVNLEVDGGGALEFFESPKILTDSSIEEFEVSSDLKISDDFSALKKFDYTYLPRENTKLLESKISFSYFDPVELKFKKSELVIPEIVIAGGGFNRSKKDSSLTTQRASNTATNSNDLESASPLNKNEFFRPIYKLVNTYRYDSKKIALLFALLALIIFVLRFRDSILTLTSKDKELGVIQKIEKEGVSYATVFEISEMVGKARGQDMLSNIKSSELSKDAKHEILSTINKLNSHYSHDSNLKIKLSKRTIKNIKKALQNG